MNVLNTKNETKYKQIPFCKTKTVISKKINPSRIYNLVFSPRFDLYLVEFIYLDEYNVHIVAL